MLVFAVDSQGMIELSFHGNIQNILFIQAYTPGY